jgi:hypothetical protein
MFFNKGNMMANMSYVVFLGLAVLNSSEKKTGEAIFEALLEQYISDGMQEPVAIDRARNELRLAERVSWSTIFFRDMAIAYDPKKTERNEAIYTAILHRYVKDGMSRGDASEKALGESFHLNWQPAGI